jgi:hypothetical protein
MEARVLRVELLADLEPDDAALNDALSAVDEALAAGAARGAHRALAAADRIATRRSGDEAKQRISLLRRRLQALG